MKKLFPICLLLLDTALCFAQKIGETFYAKDQGVRFKYEITSDKTVKIMGNTGVFKSEVTIPSTVVHKDKTYEVTVIGNEAFATSISFKKLKLGENVKAIAEKAFSKNRSLSIVEGLHPNIYVAPDAFFGCAFNFDEYKKSFEYYANAIIPEIKEWQQKKMYETTAQYKARITKENQKKKIEELMDKHIKEYTTKYPIEFHLGNYDADYEIFELKSNYGTVYIKVPLSDAPTFNKKINSAKYDASYTATKEGLRLTDMRFTLDDKKYESTQVDIDNQIAIVDIDLPDIELPIDDSTVGNVTVTDNTIDTDIPSIDKPNKNTFAVIIGNEKYTKVEAVPYAEKDAWTFAKYCQKTLGLPEKNIRKYNNTTTGTFLSAIADIKNIVKAYDGNVNVIFYYAGHGLPDEKTRDAYLMPVDVNGQLIAACYPVSKLYKELGEMGANSVVVFMDACFSGAKRGGGMLVSARGVEIEVDDAQAYGNMVIFTAAQGDETAFPYKEKGHGMFTYYLLKKLQESKGNCTLEELGDYIKTNVRQQSVVVNHKMQTPTVIPSTELGEKWKDMKLR